MLSGTFTVMKVQGVNEVSWIHTIVAVRREDFTLVHIAKTSKSQGISLSTDSKQKNIISESKPSPQKEALTTLSSLQPFFTKSLSSIHTPGFSCQCSSYALIRHSCVTRTRVLCEQQWEKPHLCLHPHTSHPSAPERHLSSGLCLSPHMACALGAPGLAKVTPWLDSDPPDQYGLSSFKA